MTKGQACLGMKKQKHKRDVPKLPTVLRKCLGCEPIHWFPSTHEEHRICDDFKNTADYRLGVPDGCEYL